jgi:transcriptional regulator of aromatic amino acid metabolism
MTDKPIKNVPASVRQRLLNKAKQDRRPFNELLQYYRMAKIAQRAKKVKVHFKPLLVMLLS